MNYTLFSISRTVRSCNQICIPLHDNLGQNPALYLFSPSFNGIQGYRAGICQNVTLLYMVVYEQSINSSS